MRTPHRAAVPVRAWSLLTPPLKRQFVAVLTLVVLRAVFDLVGVASLAPFLELAANPSLIRERTSLAAVHAFLGYPSDSSFLVGIGVVIVGLLALGNAIAALSTYQSLRFVRGVNHALASRLVAGYLQQDYNYYATRHTASLQKTVLSECELLAIGVFTPLVTSVSQSLMVGAMTALLFATSPTLAISVVVCLGGPYALLYFAIRQRSDDLGRIRTEANGQRFRILTEGFSGIKDIKILQREPHIVTRFNTASKTYGDAVASAGALPVIPRHFLETLVFAATVGAILYAARQGSSLAAMLPTMSVFVLGGYRLLPALQNLFASLSQLRLNSATLDVVLSELDSLSCTDRRVAAQRESVPFTESIEFRHVSLAFQPGTQPVLDDISFRLPKGGRLGIVGHSGSGKTTLVDVLLGLQLPTSGSVDVDGRPLSRESFAHWRTRVGYVPQQIFLADASIVENIAFALPSTAISLDRAYAAATIAQLDELLQSLPEGIHTSIGERGIRLSGGQRQRIGIARALYDEPDVIVMDEATSALDGATEDDLMRAINSVAADKTLVMVAHRLSTVRDCDLILILEQGRVVESGTWETLSLHSDRLRRLARAGAASGAIHSTRAAQ